jgi:hypothetical protein
MARVSRAASGGRRPLTTSRLRKKEASMRSTALPAELAPSCRGPDLTTRKRTPPIVSHKKQVQHV